VRDERKVWELDHVVLAVRNLARAIRHFESLGFTVVRGGEHASGRTHNALIAFADGSYLELLALKRWSQRTLLRVLGSIGALGAITARLPLRERRFVEQFIAGGGLVDFAILSHDIDGAIAAMRERGIAVDGPLAQGRTRPDGQRLSWKLAMPRAGDLPFIIADVTPRALRVPDGAARRHRNAVMGIASLVMAVMRLDVSAERYGGLLGAEPERISREPVPGARTVDFILGSTAITLVQPTNAASPVGRFLALSGERPYAIRLHTSRRVGAEALDPARTEGARIELVSTGE
jgi:catechol 2,3-dioxygenase-like lactoylglutathione lyase family enzyme